MVGEVTEFLWGCPPLPTLSPSKGEKGVVLIRKNPLPRLRRYFPQRGKIYGSMIFPLWGKWPEGPKGDLFDQPSS